MTVCTYISPFGNPAISSDIVVTNRSLPSVKRPGEPITFKSRHDSVITHARKNFIMSPNTCFALSGEGDFHSFLRECRENIHLYELGGRPSDHIVKLAEQFGDISVISSHISNDFKENLGYTKDAVVDLKSELLGILCSIGSGSERIKKWLSEYLPVIKKMRDDHLRGEISIFKNEKFDEAASTALFDEASAHEIVRGLFSATSARYLYNDIVGNSTKLTHGAFTEYSYFCRKNQRWKRQDPQVFFFYIFEKIDQKILANQLDRFFAYTSDNDHGVLLSCSENIREIHYIKNIASPDPSDMQRLFDDLTPQSAIVTFLWKDSNGNLKIIGSKSTDLHEKDNIIFDKSLGLFGMDEAWLNDNSTPFLNVFLRSI